MGEREEKKKFGFVMGPMIFKLFTKRPINNVTSKLKIGMSEFSKYRF